MQLPIPAVVERLQISHSHDIKDASDLTNALVFSLCDFLDQHNYLLISQYLPPDLPLYNSNSLIATPCTLVFIFGELRSILPGT